MDNSIQIHIFAMENGISIMEEFKEKTYAELKRMEAQFQDEYRKKMDECAKKNMGFQEFADEAKTIKENLYFIKKYLHLNADPVLEFGKEWKGIRYEIGEFKSMVMNGTFTDEDGVGYYATIDSKSDVEISPSDVLEGIVREDFSHVIWFEKNKK